MREYKQQFTVWLFNTDTDVIQTSTQKVYEAYSLEDMSGLVLHADKFYDNNS